MTNKGKKIDYDKELDGPPQVAIEKTNRSFLQTINPGYIAAGVATIWAAAEKSDGAFWKNQHNEGLTKPLEKEGAEKTLEAIRAAGPNKNARMKAYSATTKEYTGRIEGLIHEELGIEPGLKGAVDRFKLNRPWQKRQFGLVVATVASVAIGAITSFVRERKLSDELHYQIANRSDQEPSR